MRKWYAFYTLNQAPSASNSLENFYFWAENPLDALNIVEYISRVENITILGIAPDLNLVSTLKPEPIKLNEAWRSESRR